jgi:hypothetical protein
LAAELAVGRVAGKTDLIHRNRQLRRAFPDIPLEAASSFG